MQIQISWLKKPTYLYLNCLQRQGIFGTSRTRVKSVLVGSSSTIIILNTWDRLAFANSVDPDQMPQNAANRIYTVCHTCSSILDTSRGSRIDYFKFQDRYVRLYDIYIPKEKQLICLQTVETHSALSDLDLHCLPVSCLGISSVQRVNFTSSLH